MFARRTVRRRIDDALAVASPLAIAEAMDAYICTRDTEDLRRLIARSVKRMDHADCKQLELYLNLDEADDLLGHRFSAFLRQNPRAVAALDPDAADAILMELGEIPRVQRFTRRLPAPTYAFVAIVLAIAVLPLAAQYARQRGLLQGLSDPISLPVITPFVQRVSARTVPPHIVKVPARPVHRLVVHHARKHARPRYVAHHRIVPKPRIHRLPLIAWKFDPRNNPYFYHARWRHPFTADASLFGQRARLTVRSYLHEIVAGNLGGALAHLGMRSDADTNAIAELPIITRRTMVAIVGSKAEGDREQVQADIITDGREYYEVFYVVPDGPATRITDRYYIPVNRQAQIALRSLVQNTH